ncbi:hypothetical protein Kpho01_45170 [Kitasatospora phosalacinea]|uniref:Uncharacterized protein n=1 Tax=Kitasatospora phosalacinea TaxID=2065 RepID=A0A9W6PKG5_9ACTN|nr:hypothetical protein Kpho01_45170 [Kitasatospora phosalacinea]
MLLPVTRANSTGETPASATPSTAHRAITFQACLVENPVSARITVALRLRGCWWTAVAAR